MYNNTFYLYPSGSVINKNDFHRLGEGVNNCNNIIILCFSSVAFLVKLETYDSF